MGSDPLIHPGLTPWVPSVHLNRDESRQPGSAALPSPQPSPPVPGEREHLSLSRLRERVGVRVAKQGQAKQGQTRLRQPAGGQVPGEREHLSLSRLRERVGVRVQASPQKALLSFIVNQVGPCTIAG